MDKDIRKQSRVDVVYVYERLNDILRHLDDAEINRKQEQWGMASFKASLLLDELAHNFRADTGVSIMEVADHE